MPPPIPSSVSSVAGFPGKKAFQAAIFLSDCSARHGRVDEDVQRECPFLLQVGYLYTIWRDRLSARGGGRVRGPRAVRIATKIGTRALVRALAAVKQQCGQIQDCFVEHVLWKRRTLNPCTNSAVRSPWCITRVPVCIRVFQRRERAC